MGKIYGKQDGSNELIIDGDALEQRISDLEANWESISQPTKTVQIEEGCTLYYYPDNTVEISVYDMLMSGINTWNLGTLDKAPHHKACMALCASDGDHTGILWVNDKGQVVCKHNNSGRYNYSGNMRIPLS